MEERTIRSRPPIRPGQSGNCSPHGSPRRNERHLSPHLSGSDDDDDIDPELMELENYRDTTASLNSTLNSSSDVADYGAFKFSRTQIDKNIHFYPDGNIREVKLRKTKENIAIPRKDEESQGIGNIVTLCAIVIGVMAAISFFLYTNLSRVDVNAGSRPLLRCSFEQSKRDFPKQNKILWSSLEHGVESVLNNVPTSPSIFLLAYEDIESAHKITNSIVERTTECMDSKVNALVLSPDDLAYNEMKTDYGVVITKYQRQLKNSGVMLVNDLNKVPSKVAQAFHVFCDVQNPLVDRSIIFLTLQLTEHNHSSSFANTMHLVENYLRSNWSELEPYILDPLITRVTDQVFVLNNE